MLEAALKNSNLSDAEKAAIRAQAQTSGMTAGLNLTAVAAQQLRDEQMQQAANARLEAKMNRIDAEEEAKWHQAQAVIAGRAREAEQEKKKQAEAERQKQSATWAAFREMEKGSYVAPKEQSWWGKAGELWNNTKERVKAGSDVLYNLATAIGAVEIARQEHFLKDTQPSSKIGKPCRLYGGA